MALLDSARGAHHGSGQPCRHKCGEDCMAPTTPRRRPRSSSIRSMSLASRLSHGVYTTLYQRATSYVLDGTLPAPHPLVPQQSMLLSALPSPHTRSICITAYLTHQYYIHLHNIHNPAQAYIHTHHWFVLGRLPGFRVIVSVPKCSNPTISKCSRDVVQRSEYDTFQG
jgi:hypothetical protein